MKRFVSLMMLLMVSLTTVQVAEAKKFGGGLSLGKSFKTAPAPKNTATNTSSINKPGTAAASSSRKGLMGGLLGGLLAGGLLAAFFGGAFEGIQFLDILIIGLIAFIGFKLLRNLLAAKQASMDKQQPAFGGNTPNMHRDTSSQPNVHNFEQSSGGFGTKAESDVPHNYPPGFDVAGFVNGSREHYRTIQGAWNFNQLETIREYVSESLFDDLAAERAKLEGDQHTDVMYVDAEIVRADHDASRAQLSLQFSGRYRDNVEGIEEDIQDIWHLERDLTVDNAPWIIVGIQG
jgi:predicted lipid-binding transport protein (Tim44 family)